MQCSWRFRRQSATSRSRSPNLEAVFLLADSGALRDEHPQALLHRARAPLRLPEFFARMHGQLQQHKGSLNAWCYPLLKLKQELSESKDKLNVLKGQTEDHDREVSLMTKRWEDRYSAAQAESMALKSKREELQKELTEMRNELRSEVGASPLHTAAGDSHTEIVRMLLERGADVDKATTDGGATPLYTAAELGRTEIVRILLEHRADVDKATSSCGTTPLIIIGSACADGEGAGVRHVTARTRGAAVARAANRARFRVGGFGKRRKRSARRG